MEYEVFAALYEEMNAPWVWFATPCLPSRTIVRIRCERTKKSTCCECRIIDANFLRYYNEGNRRKNISDPSNALVISDWYRRNLGIENPGMLVSLEVETCNDWWGELGLYRHHPDRIVRLAASLGILSVSVTVILGALSILLSKLN